MRGDPGSDEGGVLEFRAPKHVFGGTDFHGNGLQVERVAFYVGNGDERGGGGDFVVRVEAFEKCRREEIGAGGAGIELGELDFLVAPALDADGEAGAQCFCGGIVHRDGDGSPLAIGAGAEGGVVGEDGIDFAVDAGHDGVDRLKSANGGLGARIVLGNVGGRFGQSGCAKQT